VAEKLTKSKKFAAIGGAIFGAAIGAILGIMAYNGQWLG